jgi:uncharacterized membrane protein YvbJ
MQCEACGAILHEGATACPNCRAPVSTAAPPAETYEEETWFAAVERIFTRYFTLRRAKIIIGVAVVVLILAVLLAWHPWRRLERPSPYSFPVPGLQR